MIEVSAQELCKTRLCATPGCPEDADNGSPVCRDCERGAGQVAFRELLHGPTKHDAPLHGRKRRRKASGELTAAELVVLRCAANGLSMKDTAWRHGKSVHTVNTQRRTIFDKLGTSSILHAVALGFRSGLIQ